MTLLYPLPDEYGRAVQTPGTVFAQEDLQAASFPTPAGSSVPRPAGSGTSAVVFRARVGGRDEAVRFFTRESADRLRYEALGLAVRSNGLAHGVPAARWVERGILVQDRWWPIVRMDWVAGTSLDLYVETLIEDGDTASLRALAGTWQEFVRRLQLAGVAHGDLQHGNILVDDAERLHLVDLDSVWLPAIDHLGPPGEAGHEDYQPHGQPQVWGRYMDTFPGLVISLSLTALSRRPGLWDEYWSEQNLIFSRADYAAPFDTAIWRDIATIADPQVRHQAARLREACVAGGAGLGCGLDAVLGQGTARPGATIPPWWTQEPPVRPRPGPPPPAEGVTPLRVAPKPGGHGWEWRPPENTPRRHLGKVAPHPPEASEGAATTKATAPPPPNGYRRVLKVMFLLVMLLILAAVFTVALLRGG